MSCLALAFVFAACEDGANEYGRLDNLDESIPAPSAVIVDQDGIVPTSGGAIIPFSIPDDDNIAGVCAKYWRNGEEIVTKVSRYVNSIEVAGFADTKERTISVSSFNVNGVSSPEVDVKITPLEPAVKLAKLLLFQSFGGIKVRVEGNTPKADLTIVLLKDKDVSDLDKPASQTKWEDLTVLFTAAKEITLSRRGIAPEEALFGAYIRDRWGNISDTVRAVLTPLEEVKLDRLLFKKANVADDNMEPSSGSYPFTALWDGYNDDGKGRYLFDSMSQDMPGWFTIDLGVKAKLSHIQIWHRGLDYVPYAQAHPREYEFWGSSNPTGEVMEGNEHGFDNSWVKLGRFEQLKPSGYEADGSVGTITQDDLQYWMGGCDFELNNEEFEHAFDEIRYLRVVILNTFSSYEFHGPSKVQLGEIIPYGQVL